MYSKGSDQVKEWILNVALMEKREKQAKQINEEGEGNQDLGMASSPLPQNSEAPEEEMEEEPPSSPFDILERVRDICNKNLKDPEDDEEIEKILKEIATEVKDYASVQDEEEDEKVSGEQQPSQPDPNAQAPTGMGVGQDMGQDMGAPGGDMGATIGGGMGAAPAGGGQM